MEINCLGNGNKAKFSYLEEPTTLGTILQEKFTAIPIGKKQGKY